jgi:hypothetical protein
MSSDNAKILHEYIATIDLDPATRTRILNYLQPIIFLERSAFRTSLPTIILAVSNSIDYVDEFCRYVWEQKIGWDNTMGILERLDPIIDALHDEGKTATKPAKQITLEDIMSELGID